jgi:hypothetical protein
MFYFYSAVVSAARTGRICSIAIVCGMGASSVKTLKLFGATKRKPSISFHAKVYAPLLLKCSQNLFLNYDV